jgi:hypothetical protein
MWMICCGSGCSWMMLRSSSDWVDYEVWLCFGSVVLLEKADRDEDDGEKEDQGADDPHDDGADDLIGERRYVEWVWLPEVVAVDGAIAEGEEG